MNDLAGWPLVTICGVLGLAFGSFANVAVYRWPRKGSVVNPPSACPSCGEAIRALDNIPVASWMRLRGRCRHCGERISLRYPLVELLVGVVWAVVAAVYGATWLLPALLVLCWALVVATLIDLEHLIIPNRLTYPLAPVVLALLVLAAVLDGGLDRLVRALVVGVALPGAMLLLSEIFRLVRGQAGMGMGDVKLALSLGLVLGYLGGWYVVIGLYTTIIAGVLVAGGLVLAGRARLATRIPFGPYLAIGTLVAVLAGRPLATSVQSWLGLT